jgi:hypothetical protein
MFLLQWENAVMRATIEMGTWGTLAFCRKTKRVTNRGLRYDDVAIHPGAQTERRGVAGPGRDLLGGETSPTALIFSVQRHDELKPILCLMFSEGFVIAITVEAVYEGGVLKPAQPLPQNHRPEGD